MSDLMEADAIIQVADEAGLAGEVKRLFGDPSGAARLGERATAAVLRRQGVVGKCVGEIRESIR